MTSKENDLKLILLDSKTFILEHKIYAVEPWFTDLWYNNILIITINIHLPSKNYSRMYGAEPRYNNLQYNNIPDLTMGMSLTERKMFSVITIKSILQTTRNTSVVQQNNFYYIN